MPTVSVVLPVYNRASVIPRAIDSVLKQSFTDFELIIIDDGSTDNISKVINEYDDYRIRYFKQENQGANAARNNGIRNSAGDFISFLDSDDELHRDNLKLTVKNLKEESSDCAGVFTSFEKFRAGKIEDISIAPPRKITYDDIRDGNIIGGFSSTMFRSDIFEKVGYLDEKLPSSQDYDFYLRVLDEFSMLGLHKVLLTKHNSDDRIGTNLQKKIQGFRHISAKHGSNLTASRKAQQASVEGVLYMSHDEIEMARHKFRVAISYDYKNPKYYYYYVFSFLGVGIFTTATNVAKLFRKKIKIYRVRKQGYDLK